MVVDRGLMQRAIPSYWSRALSVASWRSTRRMLALRSMRAPIGSIVEIVVKSFRANTVGARNLDRETPDAPSGTHFRTVVS